MAARTYTTRRSAIVDALVVKLKQINQTGDFLTDVFDNVHPRLKFWDEVDVFPSLHMSAGTETREYYGGGQKFRFLTVTLRVYVNADDPIQELEEALEDIETVIDNAGHFNYSATEGTQNIMQTTVVSISTDEGVLAPLGVGEMILEIRY